MQIIVEERQSTIEYQRFGVQGKTYKKVDGEICGAVYDRRSSLIKHSQTMVADFDENTSSSQYKLDSIV